MPHTIYERGPVNDLIIKGIKAPLRKLLEMVVDRMPEPTKENVRHEDTRSIIELRDEFFTHDTNVGRHKMYRGVWNFVIALYDYDAYYRERINWIIRKVAGWEPQDKPAKHWWKED